MFEKLFTPLQIRDLHLPHRIVLPAMGTKFSGNDSYVTDRLIAYHVARVRGGSGLNIVEVASVHTPSAPRHFLSISDDRYIPGLKKLTDAIHEEGGNAGIQLWQGSLAVGMDQTAQILVASDMPVAPGIRRPGCGQSRPSRLRLHRIPLCPQLSASFLPFRRHQSPDGRIRRKL